MKGEKKKRKKKPVYYHKLGLGELGKRERAGQIGTGVARGLGKKGGDRAGGRCGETISKNGQMENQSPRDMERYKKKINEWINPIWKKNRHRIRNFGG